MNVWMKKLRRLKMKWVIACRLYDHTNLLGMQKGLDEHQSAGVPALLCTKKDTTRDFLTIFTIRIQVSFKKNEKAEVLEGRWCMVCKWVIQNKDKAWTDTYLPSEAKLMRTSGWSSNHVTPSASVLSLARILLVTTISAHITMRSTKLAVQQQHRR
jgi:hypothetical protein